MNVLANAAPPPTPLPARPIRIARIIARLNIGGPAIHTVLATAGLDRERFETTLITGRTAEREGDMGYFAQEHGIEPLDLPELGREIRTFADVRALVALVRLLRRYKPDIVHTHTAKAGTLGRIAALLAGVPVRVHTFHGHVFDGYFPPWKTRLFLAVERLLARGTQRIVTVSEGQRRELIETFAIAGADRISVLPLGLDLAPLLRCDALAGKLRAELGLGADARTVGIVGRMVPIKNHELFFDAAALLAAERPELHFVVVGGGEREAQVRAKAAASLPPDRVHFLGWRRDLANVYAGFDCVALTSKNEGTPVALIEAMAAGVPVAATAVGGVPDLLRGGERGELVAPPFTPQAVAQAITRALEPARRQKAAPLRKRILEEYGAERLCRDLEALYTDLLRDRR